MPLRTKFYFFSIIVGILFALTGLGLFFVLDIIQKDYDQFFVQNDSMQKELNTIKEKNSELEKKDQAFAEY